MTGCSVLKTLRNSLFFHNYEYAEIIKQFGTKKYKKRNRKTTKDLIDEAIQGKSYPVVFISSTVGAMKLAFKGHHYKYSFKRNNLSIYQCCYSQHNAYGKQEQCNAKVVVRNEQAYAMDEEHSHVDLAFDKSTTFTKLVMKASKHTHDAPDEDSVISIKAEQSSTPKNFFSAKTGQIQIKKENSISKRRIKQTKDNEVEIINAAIKDNSDDDDDDDDSMSPEDFRKKIKARLSRVLLKK